MQDFPKLKSGTCPRCGNPDTKLTHTSRRVDEFRCRDCGKRWEEREEPSLGDAYDVMRRQGHIH